VGKATGQWGHKRKEQYAPFNYGHHTGGWQRQCRLRLRGILVDGVKIARAERVGAF
jgi:hypothetical protein